MSNRPQPFTFEHFNQAIQSLTDEMLMYYIDEAVGIYCRLKGITIGPRPASSKDYSPQYADAFEAANYAVYLVATKIDSYNPQRGDFKPYLDKALENALKDTMKADGQGDFFDQTSKKKHKDDEPEKHSRVDVDHFRVSSESASEPDSVVSDTAERVQKHKDDAFEAMIRFIDSLPDIKRSAIYASAFGQILRPDLPGYGRNYAEVLASIYHTTALYIRQLATEGKKAALAEARRLGFDERSMSDVHIGMVQSKANILRDPNEAVLQAEGKLDPFQQFMLLRHLADKEKTNRINNMAFEYKPENAKLTPSQEALLGRIEGLASPFKGVANLKEIRGITGVSVVVADRTYLVKILKDSIKRINDQIGKYHQDANRSKIFRQIERDIFARCRWAEDQLKKASLLGLYSRKVLWFDNSSPIVFLFADNINDYSASIGKSADNVFGYVFLHEMMHAYFDSFHSEGFPSWEELEEPFAEFGMLTFIQKSKLPVDLLEDAKEHVQSKVDFGPREYGFGLALFNRTGGGDPSMIENYRAISNWIDAEIISSWKSSDKYFTDIGHYQRDPSYENAEKCYNGVKEILDFDWEEPELVIQSRIRGSRSTSGPLSGSRSRSSHVLPKLFAKEEWAVSASKIEWCAQYPLLKSDDLVQLMVDVLKVMKSEGFESYLLFADDKINFLGRPFSCYARTTAKPNHTIPESIDVKGTVVFPAFKLPLLGGPAGQVGNILYALGTLLDGTFTLAHEGPGFVLYGPSRYCALFSKNTESTSSAVAFQILDKSSLRVLDSEKEMGKTALFIVKDYCSNHPRVTLAELQKFFSSVHPHRLNSFSIIELKGSVPPKYEKRYFMEDAITLSTGDSICVTREWTKNANFKDFAIIVDGLGYIIEF